MSWLFGKKKQKDSPPESTEEEASSDQSEGYIFVEPKRPAPPPPVQNPGVGDAIGYPSGGLYPYIGQVPTYPGVTSNDMAKDANLGEGTHYLSGVPFKPCKRLERTMNNDLEIDSFRISEILSFIDRIQNENYDYDFVLEEGVIAEMNSSNVE